MPKMVKTANEIAAMVVTASIKVGQCEGLTGVTVQRIDDEKVPFNWTVSIAHNSPGKLCDVAIATIVDGTQRVIDLAD